MTPEEQNKVLLALIACKVQAHYFLCHGINGHKDRTDRGDCTAEFCIQAREAIDIVAKLKPEHTAT